MTSAAMAIDDVERLQARVERARAGAEAPARGHRDPPGDRRLAALRRHRAVRGPAAGRDIRPGPLLDLPGRARRRQRAPGGELRGPRASGTTWWTSTAIRSCAARCRPARRCSSPTRRPIRTLGPCRWALWPAPGQVHHRGADHVAGRRHRRDLPPHLPRRRPASPTPTSSSARSWPTSPRKALRNAHRFERLQAAEGRGRPRRAAGSGAGRAARLLRRLLALRRPQAPSDDDDAWPTASAEEIERLVGVAHGGPDARRPPAR